MTVVCYDCVCYRCRSNVFIFDSPPPPITTTLADFGSDILLISIISTCVVLLEEKELSLNLSLSLSLSLSPLAE